MTIRLGKVCVGSTCRSVPFSPNRKMHWATKYKWANAWKEEVGWRCIENKVKMPTGRAKVGIILYTCRPQDQDNSVASIKNLLDGLKGIAIKDDNHNDIDLSVRTIKVGKKIDERVELEL